MEYEYKELCELNIGLKIISNMKILTKYIIILILSIVLFSCNNKQSNNEGKFAFRYNESKGIATLDPAFASNQSVIWPVNQLFNGLVQLDENLKIKPCIAHSWDVSDDGKLYTFYLRNDVLFHNHKVFKNGKGRRVISQDFVFSLGRILNPETASPGAWIFLNIDKTKGENGFYAVNDSTLQIYLTQPFPAFLSILSMQYCSVVPPEIVKFYNNDFRRNPVGTGPFQFKMWQEGEKLVFIKNPHYFEKDNKGKSLPYLDAVAITFIRDKQSEFMEFVKGNIDFISGLNAGYKDELITREGNLNPKYDNKFKMLTQSYLNTEYLAFLIDTTMSSVKNSPLSIKKIRQAINYGFDRKKMMRYMRNNIGTPANNGFIPDGLLLNNDSVGYGFYYNPDLSLKLLDEAGYKNGEGLLEITLTTNSDYLDLCEYIQHQLDNIGIKLKIEVGTGASFREMVAQSKINFFRASWIADYPDAENYLALFYSKNFSPNGPNYTHYNNTAYDVLYEQAMNETNDSIRNIYYYRLDKMIIDDAVIVPLYYDQVLLFVQKNISGLETNAMNLLSLKNVKMKE